MGEQLLTINPYTQMKFITIKRYSLAAIASALEQAGFKPYSAQTCAAYLKGKASFQAACDAGRNN